MRENGYIDNYNQVAFLFRSVKSKEAIEIGDYLEENGIPVYSGGISPQWDGRWNTVDVDLFCGVHTDIIKYESKSLSKKAYP